VSERSVRAGAAAPLPAPVPVAIHPPEVSVPESGVVFELFVDVLCPFSLLAVRRAREALGEFDRGAAALRLRALPLLEDVTRYERACGSREGARMAFSQRIRDAVGLAGGESFFVAADALRDGRLLLSSSLPALAAVKWADAAAGEVAAFRLFVELSSRWLEHAEDIGERDVLFAAAAEVGLPVDELARALAAPAAARAVARDVREARALGLTCTPVASVDGGPRLEGLATADEYREALAKRLEPAVAGWR
jgi:predicted DsbA family dithiol-disulfide isomerase